MIEIPVPSEVTNVINFFVLDLLLLPYVMFASGKLAGYANHRILRTGNPLKLVVFDPPVVGGGIVMARGTPRVMLIAARLTVVAAVATCNFGLEGRSRLSFVKREAVVRRPGPLTERFMDVYDATERRMRCSGSTERDAFFFGAVIDDVCYLNSSEYVYVQQLSYQFDVINATADYCKLQSRCRSRTTVFRCLDADIVCGGLPKESECAGAEGVIHDSCHSVVYSKGSPYAYLCSQGWLRPGDVNREISCRRLVAKRDDIAAWVDHLLMSTFDPLTAVFAAAYGKEERAVVKIPEGELLVTVVRLWWFIPTVWVLLVAGILTILCFHQYRCELQLFAHDERGLAGLLQQEMTVKLSTEDETGSGIIQIGDERGTIE